MLFNGTDLTQYLRIKRITGRGFLSREQEIRSTAGADGGLLQRVRRTSRPIVVEADVFADTSIELREKIDELNGILDVDVPVEIIFPDEPNKTYYGSPEKSGEDEDFIFMHKGAIVFICPDPNKYGPVSQVSFTSSSLTFLNGGTADIKPIMDVSIGAPITSFTLSNGSEELRIIYNFIAGDVVTIDFKTRKVLINNIIRMTSIDLNKPDFFPLVKGDNNLTITPFNPTVITFREAWK